MGVPVTTREKTKRVEVLLTPENYEDLKKAASSSGLTMSTVVKLALKEYLCILWYKNLCRSSNR